ncbi:hypothetical protein NMG60_11022431 [Bertholletia excelsa]
MSPEMRTQDRSQALEENPHQPMTRFNLNRVRGTYFTNRVYKLVCAIILGFLFFLGVITFILWLSLRPHRPKIHIRDFSIPGLAQPNGFQNARVVLNLTVHNPNHKNGIFYNSMQLNLYHNDQQIGRASVSPFYEGPHTTVVFYGQLRGAMLMVEKKHWIEFEDDRVDGELIFRLKITSTIRFKSFAWNHKQRKIHNSCDIRVGPDGLILATYKDKKCAVHLS